MNNDFRAFAHELDTARTGGGFRSRMSIDDSPVPDRIVSLAVARAKEGDREAVRFLYLRYADNVYGYVRSIVRDDYEAEDVTQHVFAKLMTVIGKYEQRDVAVLGLDPAGGAQRRGRPHAPAPADPVRGGPRAARSTTTTRSAASPLADPARRARHAARRAARGRRAAPPRRPQPRRDRRPARPHRAVRSTACTTAAAARCAPRCADMECAPTVGTRRWRHDRASRTDLRAPIPVTRLDQADPVLLEELLEVVERVARKGAFTCGAELEAFETEFAAYCGTDARRRRLLGHRGDLARAARAGHRPRRRGHRPDATRSSRRPRRSAGRRDAGARRRRPARRT